MDTDVRPLICRVQSDRNAKLKETQIQGQEKWNKYRDNLKKFVIDKTMNNLKGINKMLKQTAQDGLTSFKICNINISEREYYFFGRKLWDYDDHVIYALSWESKLVTTMQHELLDIIKEINKSFAPLSKTPIKLRLCRSPDYIQFNLRVDIMMVNA